MLQLQLASCKLHSRIINANAIAWLMLFIATVANSVMAGIVMAYIGMAYIVMACIVASI